VPQSNAKPLLPTAHPPGKRRASDCPQQGERIRCRGVVRCTCAVSALVFAPLGRFLPLDSQHLNPTARGPAMPMAGSTSVALHFGNCLATMQGRLLQCATRHHRMRFAVRSMTGLQIAEGSFTCRLEVIMKRTFGPIVVALAVLVLYGPAPARASRAPGSTAIRAAHWTHGKTMIVPAEDSGGDDSDEGDPGDDGSDSEGTK